jgi:putative NADH-flavin reductase
VKLFVIGATGGTGKNVVEHALAKGHDVVAFVRNPSALTVVHERLRVERGDALDSAEVKRAAAGCDAAISAIGPRRGTPAGTIISGAVMNILGAMTNGGPRRIVFESGLMVGDGRGLRAFGRVAVSIFRRLNRALYEDKVRAEGAIRASPYEWIIVRPPALVEKAARGTYRVGVDLDVRVSAPMAHADVAAFLVEAAESDRWLRQTVDLSY